MKWKNLTAACVALMMTASVGAENYHDPCCEPCPSDCSFDFCSDPCCGWTIYGDWLYWKARRCDLVYALDFTLDGDGGQIIESVDGEHTVCPGWDSGFRFGVIKECCDFDVGIHYTHYHADDKNKFVSPAGLIIAPNLGEVALGPLNGLGSIQFASARYELDYDIVDVEVGYDLNMEACTHARVFGGFKYANIDQKYKRDYSNEAAPDESSDYVNVNSKLDLVAYGLYLGADASYNLCDCLDLFGSFSYGALVGKFDTKYTSSFTETDSDSTVTLITQTAGFRDHCWKMVSNLNLAVGIEYTLSNCFCADWAIAVGYEFHQWFCMLDFVELTIDEEEVAYFQNSDCLGLDGLFVRVTAAF